MDVKMQEYKLEQNTRWKCSEAWKKMKKWKKDKGK